MQLAILPKLLLFFFIFFPMFFVTACDKDTNEKDDTKTTTSITTTAPVTEVTTTETDDAFSLIGEYVNPNGMEIVVSDEKIYFYDLEDNLIGDYVYKFDDVQMSVDIKGADGVYMYDYYDVFTNSEGIFFQSEGQNLITLLYPDSETGKQSAKQALKLDYSDEIIGSWESVDGSAYVEFLADGTMGGDAAECTYTIEGRSLVTTLGERLAVNFIDDDTLEVYIAFTNLCVTYKRVEYREEISYDLILDGTVWRNKDSKTIMGFYDGYFLYELYCLPYEIDEYGNVTLDSTNAYEQKDYQKFLVRDLPDCIGIENEEFSIHFEEDILCVENLTYEGEKLYYTQVLEYSDDIVGTWIVRSLTDELDGVFYEMFTFASDGIVYSEFNSENVVDNTYHTDNGYIVYGTDPAQELSYPYEVLEDGNTLKIYWAFETIEFASSYTRILPKVIFDPETDYHGE